MELIYLGKPNSFVSFKKLFQYLLYEEDILNENFQSECD
jgi:hypothetical protein